MLDERIERDSVEAAEKSEQTKIHSHRPDAQAVPRNQKSKNSHSDPANWNEAVFDFSARKVTRGKAAYPDADSHRGLQITDLRFVHAQHVVSIHDDHELQQRGQKPQIGIAHHCPSQDTIPRDDAKLSAKIGERVGSKSPGRIGGRQARNAEACEQPDHRDPKKSDAGPNMAPSKRVCQKSREHHRGDGCQKCAEFNHAVSPGELVVREQLGQQSILRRAKQRPLRADQKNGGGLHRQIPGGERGNSKKSYANLEHFRANRDGALAVAVGKISARERKQYERNSEEGADQQNEAVTHSRGEIALDDQVDDEKLESVVVERALKLSGDQAPEAEPPVRGETGRIYARSVSGWRFYFCSRRVFGNCGHKVVRRASA